MPEIALLAFCTRAFDVKPTRRPVTLARGRFSTFWWRRARSALAVGLASLAGGAGPLFAGLATASSPLACLLVVVLPGTRVTSTARSVFQELATISLSGVRTAVFASGFASGGSSSTTGIFSCQFFSVFRPPFFLQVYPDHGDEAKVVARLPVEGDVLVLQRHCLL